MKDLNNHGRAQAILDAGKQWREIDQYLTPRLREKIDLGKERKKVFRLAGSHNEVPYLYIPEAGEDGWDLVPWHPMATGLQDSMWYTGQEKRTS